MIKVIKVITIIMKSSCAARCRLDLATGIQHHCTIKVVLTIPGQLHYDENNNEISFYFR